MFQWKVMRDFNKTQRNLQGMKYREPSFKIKVDGQFFSEQEFIHC